MVVLVAATVLLLYILIQPTQPNSKVYTDYQSDVQSGQVSKVVRDGFSGRVPTAERGPETC